MSSIDERKKLEYDLFMKQGTPAAINGESRLKSTSAGNVNTYSVSNRGQCAVFASTTVEGARDPSLRAGNRMQFLYFTPKKNHSNYKLRTGNSKHPCMTRSLTSELFTPYKEPEREFRSSRRHFKTLSLDELRSPDFNLFFDQEYSEKEVAKTMAETMEQYMSKTRADYGSGVTRPKIEDKDNYELKVPIFSGTAGAIPSKTAADAKASIQEMVEYSQKWHNGTSRSKSTKTSDGLAAIQAQLNNLGR
ncbi:hypothetical protein Tco_0803416 [Tanacetum coccineum]|uniref:Uncharacterized protein n=1 Tax=Tanacetum coccineum TaxID=301880 RepID=A0ABQ5A1P0_9ASTR